MTRRARRVNNVAHCTICGVGATENVVNGSTNKQNLCLDKSYFNAGKGMRRSEAAL